MKFGCCARASLGLFLLFAVVFDCPTEAARLLGRTVIGGNTFPRLAATTPATRRAAKKYARKERKAEFHILDTNFLMGGSGVLNQFRGSSTRLVTSARVLTELQHLAESKGAKGQRAGEVLDFFSELGITESSRGPIPLPTGEGVTLRIVGIRRGRFPTVDNELIQVAMSHHQNGQKVFLWTRDREMDRNANRKGITVIGIKRNEHRQKKLRPTQFEMPDRSDRENEPRVRRSHKHKTKTKRRYRA